MRVLYAIESLGEGGTERSLAEMLPPLAAAGVVAEVLCFQHREGVHEQVEAAGVAVSVLPPGGWRRRIGALRRHLRARRPDLLHTALLRTDLAGRVAAAGLGVPVLSSLVSTPYDPVRRLDPAVPATRLEAVRIADSATARWLCDHLHAVSHAVRRAAIESLGVAPERVTVVPRGRDPHRLGRRSTERRRRARAALGLDEDREVVLHAGRHEFAKGLPDLAAAFEILAVKRPKTLLLSAGRPGPAGAALERLAAGGGDARVRLLGHRDDLPELMAAADIFAFPSLYEGMPGAVIEAMALELPVVATDIPPVREVVDPGRSALLVPPGRPSRLAEALDTMLADRDRAAAFGRRGREVFEERFTLERSMRGMLDLYHRLAPARSRTTGEA